MSFLLAFLWFPVPNQWVYVFIACGFVFYYLSPTCSFSTSSLRDCGSKPFFSFLFPFLDLKFVTTLKTFFFPKIPYGFHPYFYLSLQTSILRVSSFNFLNGNTIVVFVWISTNVFSCLKILFLVRFNSYSWQVFVPLSSVMWRCTDYFRPVIANPSKVCCLLCSQ